MTQALLDTPRPDPSDWQSDPLDPATSSPPAQSPTRRGWRWLVVAACLAGGGIVMLRLTSGPAPSSPAVIASPVVRTSVTALGWLEPASTVVRIAAPATVEASRIAELRIVEGDAVEAGQVIAVLDTAAKLEAQLKASEAQVALKRALLERVKLDTASSVVAKRMAIARARADVEQTEAEFARQKILVAREIATPANLEKRRRDLAVAQAQIEEAQAALQRLEAVLPGEVNAALRIDVAIAARELAAAEADLAQVRVTLDQASIRSPIRGRVLTVLTQGGEKISQDGVAEVGSTDAMIAVGEVYQSDIGLIRIGQRVEVRAEMLKEPVTGRVERIGLKVKRQSIINNDPATDTDARVIEVRVALDAESSARVSSLTRLQVRLHFALDQATAASQALTSVEVQR